MTLKHRIHRLCHGQRTLMWDTFTDADGTLLPSHVSDDGMPWLPQASVVTTALQIHNNRVHVTGSGVVTGTARKRWPRHRRNYKVTVGIVMKSDNNTGNAGPLARCSRLQGLMLIHGRHLVLGTNTWNIMQFRVSANVQAGSSTNQTLTVDQEYTASLEVRGGRAILRVDGTIVSQGDILCAYPQAAVMPGFRMTDTDGSETVGLQIDNWRVER